MSIRLLEGHERLYLIGAGAFVSMPKHDALSLLGGGNTRRAPQRHSNLGVNARRESVHHTPTETVAVQAGLYKTPAQDLGSVERESFLIWRPALPAALSQDFAPGITIVSAPSACRAPPVNQHPQGTRHRTIEDDRRRICSTSPPHQVVERPQEKPPGFKMIIDTIQSRPREEYTPQIDIAILWIASIAPPILKQTPRTRDLLDNFSATSSSLPNPPMGKKRGQEKKGMTTNQLNELVLEEDVLFPYIGRNIEGRGSKLLFAEVIEQNVESHFALDVGSAVTYKMLVLVSKRGLHSDSSHAVVMVPGLSQAQHGKLAYLAGGSNVVPHRERVAGPYNVEIRACSGIATK
ncbi:hypothetical protein BKA70DRAFT_1221425 [Coprinopsis sp. MPI-PUGE-AT-0042]|nr:hypothetical protein BKA70DRAFT_1221425 [Coprinopsis sp. MPI-PUGE-AT-0042]